MIVGELPWPGCTRHSPHNIMAHILLIRLIYSLVGWAPLHGFLAGGMSE